MRINSKLFLFLFCTGILIVSCDSDDDYYKSSDFVNSNASVAGIEESEEGIVVSQLFYENLLFINHRGLTEYPENTFAAVNAAVESGFI